MTYSVIQEGGKNKGSNASFEVITFLDTSLASVKSMLQSSLFSQFHPYFHPKSWRNSVSLGYNMLL